MDGTAHTESESFIIACKRRFCDDCISLNFFPVYTGCYGIPHIQVIIVLIQNLCFSVSLHSQDHAAAFHQLFIELFKVLLAFCNLKMGKPGLIHSIYITHRVVILPHRDKASVRILTGFLRDSLLIIHLNI